jgi:hypothetical protein
MRIGITVSYLRERIFILYQRNLSIGSNQTNQPRTLIRTRAVHRRVGKWSKRANGQNPDPKLKKKQKKRASGVKQSSPGSGTMMMSPAATSAVDTHQIGGGHSSDRWLWCGGSSGVTIVGTVYL